MTPTVDITDILRTAPLVSASAWLLLAILQVYRDRWHTWTETFFLAACFFAGLYAVSDWLFFNADPARPDLAVVAAQASLGSLTLAAVFLLLFTAVYLDRMRRSLWGLAGVAGVVLIVGALSIERVDPPNASVPLYHAVFRPLLFGIFLVYLVIYAGLSNWNLYRLYRIVRESSPTLGRRAAGLLVTFSLSLFFGVVTNGLIGIAQTSGLPPPLAELAHTPPPFSTLLGLVAGSAYYTIYPVGRQRISEAIRLFQARRYSIKAVFLTYGDGTLIGSKVRPGEKVVDEDLFGATLDVIQNFMRTSFPILRGKSLSAITHGSYTLVMERGRYAYITVVLEGEESDQLRRQMRDLLLDFEAENREVLVKWQGVPSDAKGTEEMLTEFFIESPLV